MKEINTSKNIYIVAGPNGAGKTTFAKKFLPRYAHCPNFVNADLIAQGLSPFSPQMVAIKSGKLVLKQIREFAKKGVDFGFETTLSGKLYVNLFKELKTEGYKLNLYFLWVPNSALAVRRIRDRVAEGGHNVPANDVRRRFKRSIHNFFELYQPFLDYWMLFDNAGLIPVLIAEEGEGYNRVFNEPLFENIKRTAE